LNNDSYLLIECSKQLVLAVEYANLHTRRWLERGLYYGYGATTQGRLTEDTYQTLQCYLQRASTAIRASVGFSFLNFTVQFLEAENTDIVSRNSRMSAFTK
jgi:hypothetical protein